MASVPLFLSAPHSCSYLSEQQARSVFVSPKFALTNAIYSQLISKGFRRSGNQVYKPHCEHCQQCIPVRIPVTQFQASRKQKRCLQQNVDTQVLIKPAIFDRRHYEMYLRYQHQRHADGSMADSSPEDYLSFLSSSWCQSRFIEFYIETELAAVAVVDFLNDSLSAVYTFFEPKFSAYSLGTYAVLWQIQQAQKLNLSYVYLGFWIEECKKMAYKNQYRPLQGFINEQWQFIGNNPKSEQ
jgi:leucyl-tRNA---protein transferase